MPDLSRELASIDSLARKTPLTPQQRMLLRQDLFAHNDRDEKVITGLLHNARDTLTENWSGFMKDLRSGTISGETHAALSALTLVGLTAMTVASPVLGAATVASLTFKPGQKTSDWLVDHGFHPNMAAAVGTIMDSGPQAVMTISQVKNIVAKGLIEGVPRTSAEEAKAVGKAVVSTPQNVWNYFRSKMGYGSVTKAQAQQAIQTIAAEPPMPAAKPSAPSQVERIHPAQDQPLPEGAGKMVGERKALPPPSTAQATGVDDKIKAMDRTSDLLLKAQQSQAVEETASETSKTLAAAKATMGGTETGEMTLNRVQSNQIKRDLEAHADLLERMKEPGAIRGGAPSNDEVVQRLMTTSREYQKNLEDFQAHDISREQIGREADEMISHGFGQAHVMGIEKGQSLNRPEVAALIKTIGPVFDELIKNRNRVNAGDQSAFFDVLGDLANVGALNPHYFGPRSVAGGALGELRTPSTATTQALEQMHDIFSAVSGMSIDGVDSALRYKNRIMGLLNGVKDRNELLALLTKMPDPETASKNPATWGNFLTNFFVNNLLTPASVAAKATADASTILYRGLFEKPVQAYALRPLNNILGNPLGLKQGDIAVPGEALQFLYGARAGLLKGASFLGRWDLNGMAKAAKTEEKASQFMDMGEFLGDRFGRVGEITGDVSGAASSGLQLVTNAAKITMMEAEKRALLFRKLSEQGLSREKLGTELQEQMKFLPKDIEEAGDRVANQYSFGDQMPAFFEWLGGGINQFRLMKFEVPFFRAIVNFSRWGFNRAAPTAYMSPLLDVAFHGRQADILAGGERAATAWGNILGGSIFGGAMLLYARAGYIGGGGLGFDKNRIREMRGIDAIQPYSFFGYGVQAAHPFGQMIGEAGDLGEIMNHLPATDDTFLKKAQDAFGAFLYSTTRNYGEIPALEGITNLQRIKEDMDRGRFEGLGMAAESQRSRAFATARFLEGFIPAGGVLRSAAQEVEALTGDPYVKWNATAWDQLKSDFWGFAQFIPGLDKPQPLLNILGQKQYYPDKVGPDSISRVSSYDREPTPLAKELNRLGYSMGPTPHTVLGVARSDDPSKQILVMPKEGTPLTDDEWYKFDSGRKTGFGEQSQKFLDSDLYQRLNDFQRLKGFQELERKISEGVKGRMILEPGDLHDRVMDGITRKKILLMSPEEGQPPAEEGVQ